MHFFHVIAESNDIQGRIICRDLAHGTGQQIYIYRHGTVSYTLDFRTIQQIYIDTYQSLMEQDSTVDRCRHGPVSYGTGQQIDIDTEQSLMEQDSR